MKRLNIIETILAIIAIITAIASHTIGMQVEKIVTKGRLVLKHTEFNTYDGIENVANSLETGFNGGAMGLAIISASCIIMIVWIEISRLKIER